MKLKVLPHQTSHFSAKYLTKIKGASSSHYNFAVHLVREPYPDLSGYFKSYQRGF